MASGFYAKSQFVFPRKWNGVRKYTIEIGFLICAVTDFVVYNGQANANPFGNRGMKIQGLGLRGAIDTQPLRPMHARNTENSPRSRITGVYGQGIVYVLRILGLLLSQNNLWYASNQ